jgi:hypothetical protein
VAAINFMQNKHPQRLPGILQDWSFLPLAFRSLKPYDQFITSYLCCFKCCKKLASSNETDQPKIEKTHFDKRKEEVHVVLHHNHAFVADITESL